MSSSWALIYDKFVPQEEGKRESLCALGNGHFCTRGAMEWVNAGDVHYPGTYLAGGYNRVTSEIAGRQVENEDLVNFPNWLYLTFRIKKGPWFDLSKVKILSYRQELNVRDALLSRTIRFKDSEGRRTTLISRRIMSMAKPHLAAIEWSVTAENWTGTMQVRSGLDGRVTNQGVERYQNLNGQHLEILETGKTKPDTIYLIVRTNQSRIQFAEAARIRVYQGNEEIQVKRRFHKQGKLIYQDLSFDVRPKKTLHIEKIVALYSSHDRGISEPGIEARTALERVVGFDDLVRLHRRAWDRLWQRCDIVLGNSTRIQMILRVHIFHLMQTVSPNTLDLDVGVPARGLHGEAYRGHIFWDELFIFPFLNYQIPDITQSLLLYRYRRLDEARANAREANHRGAMYPWQSGSNGREETQSVHLIPQSGEWVPDLSRFQRHVNLAIAYNLVQYVRTTGHLAFLSVYGMEMLIEISRFWASLSVYNTDRDRYEIHGVMGPDEYHEKNIGAHEPGLRNNAYTNILLSWVLRETLSLLDDMLPHRRRELVSMLELSDREISQWADISNKIFVPFHDDNIISQFEGYEKLEEFDWDFYRAKYGDIQRLDRIIKAEGDTPDRYKVSKQADVLMLFYLFNERELKEIFDRLEYPFDDQTIPKNTAYYLKRTSNGSTLSNIVHSAVTARCNREESWNLFCEALESDFSDIQHGTTSEGIHLGAMAGTVDLVQRVYMGVEIRDNVLFFNPVLPGKLDKLEYSLRFCGMWLNVRLTRRTISFLPQHGAPETVKVGVCDRIYFLKSGHRRSIRL